MVWETFPVIYHDSGIDRPAQAIWPFLPVYSEGRLPMNKQGRIISTANARLRTEGALFAPTFMGAWSTEFRVIVVVSWFYEFDSRVKPQVPYAVFPTNAPCWLMAGLARRTTLPDQSIHLTTAVITVGSQPGIEIGGPSPQSGITQRSRRGGHLAAWRQGASPEKLLRAL